MFFVAQLNYLLYFLHIEAVCITLIFSTLKVLLFLELHKKYSFFFCEYELFRLSVLLDLELWHNVSLCGSGACVRPQPT